jgi:peptide deformylase
MAFGHEAQGIWACRAAALMPSVDRFLPERPASHRSAQRWAVLVGRAGLMGRLMMDPLHGHQKVRWWNGAGAVSVTLLVMASQRIRTYGDPVLNTKASDVTNIDVKFIKLCDDMFVAMYDAPGIGLAAPQVGVQKRFFVYDIDDEPGVLINPTITESDGEWVFEEGCLSVPDMSFEIVRPKQILVSGIDLKGNEITLEADELFSRLIQHEIDHLDGVLLLEHLDDDQRREAIIELNARKLTAEAERAMKSSSGGLQLP